MGVSVLQHTGSIKFLLKHKLVPWNNPTHTLWESQQNKLGILHPKRGILVGETPVIFRFGVQTALPELLSPGDGMSQPSCTCPGHWDQWVSFQNEFGISNPFPTTGSLELSNSAQQLQGGTGRSSPSLAKGECSQHFHSCSVPSQGVDSHLSGFFPNWTQCWFPFEFFPNLTHRLTLSMQPPWSASRISIPETLWSKSQHPHSCFILAWNYTWNNIALFSPA